MEVLNMINFYDVVKESVEKAQKNSNLRTFDDKYEENLKELQTDAASEMLKTLIENNGRINYISNVYGNGKKISFKDELMTSQQFKELIPRVITKVVIEAAEPALVLVNMLEEITSDGISVVTPVISGFGSNLDIPEGGEAPSFTVSTGGFKTASMGKSGIAVTLTEEAYETLDYSIFNYILRQAGKALGRHKERKAYNMISKHSSLVATGGTGVDLQGTANGTLTFSDILSAAVKIYAAGGVADTLIINTLAAPVFLMNPSLRSLFLLSGGDLGDFYGGNVTVARTTQPELAHYLQSQVPAYKKVQFPSNVFGRGLNVVLTDFADYDEANAKTDVIVADSSMLGFNVVKQRPMTDQWTDPARDIRNFKITERYSLVPKAVAKEGEPSPYIQVIKDVAVKKGFDPELVTRNLV